jgi:adenine-specific DNA-methyltransferase
LSLDPSQPGLWIPDIARSFDPSQRIVIAEGDSRESLQHVPDGAIQLVITSPPYNIGKVYEVVTDLDEYVEALAPIIDQLVRVLAPGGSLCWQVGNFVSRSEIVPLDIVFYPAFKSRGLKLRNRIVWHFEHGLHATKRFSGRYETLLWFTKGDEYTFNLDPVRVPSKYPGKLSWKGPNKGKPTGNPLGKNPSDVWRLMIHEWEIGLWDIPNVKANHPEKSIHPCQFPIELVERCVLALSKEDDWVLDPFSGVGSALLAALRHDRRALGCERDPSYVDIAKDRIAQLFNGTLGYRPLGRPKHQPTGREKVSQVPEEWGKLRGDS